MRCGGKLFKLLNNMFNESDLHGKGFLTRAVHNCYCIARLFNFVFENVFLHTFQQKKAAILKVTYLFLVKSVKSLRLKSCSNVGLK